MRALNLFFWNNTLPPVLFCCFVANDDIPFMKRLHTLSGSGSALENGNLRRRNRSDLKQKIEDEEMK